jgi:rhodanese-related sulfurtransferase
MGLVEAMKKALRLGDASETPGRAGNAHVGEGDMGEDLVVPEVTSTELMAEMDNGGDDHLLLLDIRENFERAQARIPNSLHIPMNSLPNRLAELDPERAIVVYCAHGNRSYGVTGWLIQQDYKARSLKGGIVDWQLKKGPIERGYSGPA